MDTTYHGWIALQPIDGVYFWLRQEFPPDVTSTQRMAKATVFPSEEAATACIESWVRKMYPAAQRFSERRRWYAMKVKVHVQVVQL